MTNGRIDGLDGEMQKRMEGGIDGGTDGRIEGCRNERTEGGGRDEWGREGWMEIKIWGNIYIHADKYKYKTIDL